MHFLPKSGRYFQAVFSQFVRSGFRYNLKVKMIYILLYIQNITKINYFQYIGPSIRSLMPGIYGDEVDLR